jgi:hypothetical protein
MLSLWFMAQGDRPEISRDLDCDMMVDLTKRKIFLGRAKLTHTPKNAVLNPDFCSTTRSVAYHAL